MSYVYIFEDLDHLTDRYHDGGGVVVHADSFAEAANLIPRIVDYEPTPRDQCALCTERPLVADRIFPTTGEIDPIRRVWVFPDSGCC